MRQVITRVKVSSILQSLFAFAVLLVSAGMAFGQGKTTAQLMLADDSARPGDTVMAGIKLKMPEGWHTYWKNPGGYGLATTIKWDLPPGVTAGDIEWPVPEKLPAADQTTYVYDGEAILLVPLKVAADVKPGSLTLSATVRWLECQSECVPGKAALTAKLDVGQDTKSSQYATALQAAQGKLPKSGDGISARASWENPVKDNVRPLVFEWKSPVPANTVDFFPGPAPEYEVQPDAERVGGDAGVMRVRKLVKKLQGDWPKEISGLLVQKNGSGTTAYEVTLPIGASDSAGIAPSNAEAPAVGAVGSDSLWANLLRAFIGGLILNIMPCVLPVISLKILGFVGEARNDPAHVRKLGLLYALGVLVSFLALAVMVIAVKAAGHKAGWGMQFGSPTFIIVLTALVTLVALNLFGIFEVNLSGNVIGAAGRLASRHGPAGAFFNGVLATTLATPCTAPILGAALGFAFARSAAVIIAILLTVGVGLALPYVLLTCQPAWLKFVPKPGAWMEKFKKAMAFPMAATAVWLFSLASTQYGDRSWWLAMFLVFVGFAAWVYGEFVQRGTKHRGLSAMAAILLLAAGYGWAIEYGLKGTEAVAWQPWSPQAVAAVRSQGHPAIVDYTAKWCLTCNTAVKPVLESKSVRDKIKEVGAVPLMADYTGFAPEITDELARYQRAGVPLVVVFPKNQSKPPIVLPEAVTPGMVIDALNRAVD